MKLRAEPEVTTPDSLANADMQAILASQGYMIPCHPTFKAWPVHSHPHPNTSPVPRGLEVQTRYLGGNTHGSSGCQIGDIKGMVRQAFNFFLIPCFPIDHAVLAFLSQLFPICIASGLQPPLSLSSAPTPTSPGTISSPAFFKQCLFSLASRCPRAP